MGGGQLPNAATYFVVLKNWKERGKNLICECRYRGYQEVFRTDRKYEDTAGAE